MTQYTLSELSAMFDIPVSTIRYYHSMGNFPFLSKDDTGYIRTDEADLSSFLLLHLLKDSGCSSKKISTILHITDRLKDLPVACSERQELYSQIVDILGDHVNSILKAQKALIEQMETTNYLIWEFLQITKKGTPLYGDGKQYPGELPENIIALLKSFPEGSVVKSAGEKYSHYFVE